MANITLKIDDEQMARVEEAFATLYGYNPKLNGTKSDFFEQNLVGFIQRTTTQAEEVAIVRAARKAVSDSIKLQVKVEVETKTSADAVAAEPNP